MLTAPAAIDFILHCLLSKIEYILRKIAAIDLSSFDPPPVIGFILRILLSKIGLSCVDHPQLTLSYVDLSHCNSFYLTLHPVRNNEFLELAIRD